MNHPCLVVVRRAKINIKVYGISIYSNHYNTSREDSMQFALVDDKN